MGTRQNYQIVLTRLWDHPHACGDKLCSGRAKQSQIGSSPRVWGQDYRNYPRMRSEGIIPTRVGTSADGDFYTQFTEDHPHACGDKIGIAVKCFFLAGSSPRVWGQDRGWKVVVKSNRIIPTRVGTSIKKFLIVTILKDHPHACGDK